MKKTKNRTRIISLLIVLALLTLLAACGKSEFGVTENTEKHMTITAENANKDASFMVGTLEADDGEQIAITSSLTQGEIKVRIIKASEEQSADQLPEMDSDAIITANCSKFEGDKQTETISGDVPAGSYMVDAYCLEKASGTIQIDVKPAP